MLTTHIHNRIVALLASNAPLIMGVVNVTPDSFSDGGRFGCWSEFDYGSAIALAMELHAQGAAIVDVGGEASSFHRRGIEPVDGEQQMIRIIPVITGICAADMPHRPGISVDTRNSDVAHAALEAGADMINDISAGEHDAKMFSVVANHGCAIVLMHREAESPGQPARHYDDVCSHVFGYLAQRAQAALDAGIPANRIILDPGIGFGKSDADNWKLLSGIARLVAMRYPVLLGVSRKRFLAGLMPEDTTPLDGPRQDWTNRDTATAMATLLAAERGVRIHRVHQVALARSALATLAAMTKA